VKSRVGLVTGPRTTLSFRRGKANSDGSATCQAPPLEPRNSSAVKLGGQLRALYECHQVEGELTPHSYQLSTIQTLLLG
jgi:hypothetical protein